MQRKCCAHCPGSVTRTGEPAREHACSLPGYMTGNLRVSALAGPCKHARPRSSKSKNGDKAKSSSNNNNNNNMQEPLVGSCFDRFAIAKKFHAENLQHQPLPDRVDDAVFTREKPTEDPCMCEAVKRCQKIIPRRQVTLNRKKELSRLHKYAPALGCKKPVTYMDLAICWETPVDATYEPRRPTHIDGSEGGPAPAIFTLVTHAESQTDVRDGCIPGQVQGDDEDDEEACGCGGHQSCDKCGQNGDSAENDDLCKNLNSIHISDPGKTGAIGAPARCKRAHFMRHCAACDKNGRRATHNTRTVRSASCLQKQGCTVVGRKNNGLPPGKCQVPRPRTPYARRSFCIDTLAPPFSLVNGCRDADYPEHWRLTSIYQQSYRNPRKMREGRTLLSYDRSYV